ncbi:MAG: hypothetical protein QOD99_885 [Chthoniobacter sp.]|jgi:hypothetical protein|nr:hypothetical protein [Chthoniobacter sp.]
MKTKLFFLPAFLLTLTALHAGGANSSAVLDLSGVVLQSGHDVSVTSSQMNPAHAYNYSIAGTCHGTGRFGSFIPAGTSIGDAFDQFQPDADSFLSGTVFDALGTFPFTALNRKFHGTKHIGPVKISAAARINVVIDADGFAGISLTKVGVRLNGHLDNSDTIVFEAGAKCTVTVAPAPSASPQPDFLILIPPNVGIGNDVYNSDGTGQKHTFRVARGRTNTVLLLIQNDGPNADTIIFNGVAGQQVTNKYFDGDTDVTADVLSPGGYALSNLASGDARLLRMKVTVHPGLHPGSSEDDGLLLTSSANNSHDEVRVITVAK